MKNEILEKVFKLIILKVENEFDYNFESVEKIKNKLKNNEYVFNQIIKKMKYILKHRTLEISYILDEQNDDEDFVKSLFYKNKNAICYLFENIINYLEDDLTLSTILFSELEKGQIQHDFEDSLNKFDEKLNYKGIKHIYI